jgi:diacylglycerol kinase (ATP)
VYPVRVILIHNPGSGGDAGAAEELAADVAAAGHDVHAVDMSEEWTSALRQPADLIAVSGGDGTVRSVFKQLAGSDTPAAVLPLGTANNVARSLGVSPEADVADVAARWPEAERRRFDLLDVDASGTGMCAVESAGAGLFADVILHGSDSPDQDKLRHGLETMGEMLERCASTAWSIELDGERLDGEYLAVEVTNVGAVGPAVQLVLNADHGDGQFDLVLIGAEHRAALLDYVAARLVDQGAADLLSLPTYRGAGVRARPVAPRAVHVDDEVITHVDLLTVRAGERSLDVLSPPPAGTR